MPLAHDLLEQASHLALREAIGPPKQASLRRTISASYYALFHLLTSDGAMLCSPAAPAGLRALVQRAFDHSKMKAVCKPIGVGGLLNPGLQAILGSEVTFSAGIRQVARAFVSLQEARHTADYDVSLRLSRPYTNGYVVQAEAAFAAWEAIRGTTEANAFLAALLFQDKWGR